MNPCWSFYRLDTGEFIGRHFVGPDRAVEINTPNGCVAIEGRFDKNTQRFDLSSGVVVRHERAREEVDAELRVKRDAAVRAHIRELEEKQHRRVRELLEADDPRLQEISREIEQLRAEISAQD